MYKLKYLKYKEKYLKLKQAGGSLYEEARRRSEEDRIRRAIQLSIASAEEDKQVREAVRRSAEEDVIDTGESKRADARGRDPDFEEAVRMSIASAKEDKQVREAVRRSAEEYRQNRRSGSSKRHDDDGEVEYGESKRAEDHIKKIIKDIFKIVTNRNKPPLAVINYLIISYRKKDGFKYDEFKLQEFAKMYNQEKKTLTREQKKIFIDIYEQLRAELGQKPKRDSAPAAAPAAPATAPAAPAAAPATPATAAAAAPAPSAAASGESKSSGGPLLVPSNLEEGNIIDSLFEILQQIRNDEAVNIEELFSKFPGFGHVLADEFKNLIDVYSSDDGITKKIKEKLDETYKKIVDKIPNRTHSSQIRRDPFVVPNNGVPKGSALRKMCFWISLADGINHNNREINSRLGSDYRTNFTTLELRGRIDPNILINIDGEEFDLTGYHNAAFIFIAKKLQIKIVVYVLKNDKKGNYVDEDYKVEYDGREVGEQMTVNILHMGSHFEFIAGFGTNDGNPLAKKLVNKDLVFNLKTYQKILELTSSKDINVRMTQIKELISRTEYDEKTKEFMIKEIENTRVKNSRVKPSVPRSIIRNLLNTESPSSVGGPVYKL